jgi:hypothetical protein
MFSSLFKMFPDFFCTSANMFAANIIPFVIAAIVVGGFVMVHDSVKPALCLHNSDFTNMILSCDVLFIATLDSCTIVFATIDLTPVHQGAVAFILFSIAMFVFIACCLCGLFSNH